MYSLLSVVVWIASVAVGLCLAAAIIITAWLGDATYLWLGALACFAISVIAGNLRMRVEKRKKALETPELWWLQDED